MIPTEAETRARLTRLMDWLRLESGNNAALAILEPQPVLAESYRYRAQISAQLRLDLEMILSDNPSQQLAFDIIIGSANIELDSQYQRLMRLVGLQQTGEQVDTSDAAGEEPPKSIIVQ